MYRRAVVYALLAYSALLIYGVRPVHCIASFFDRHFRMVNAGAFDLNPCSLAFCMSVLLLPVFLMAGLRRPLWLTGAAMLIAYHPLYVVIGAYLVRPAAFAPPPYVIPAMVLIACLAVALPVCAARGENARRHANPRAPMGRGDQS